MRFTAVTKRQLERCPDDCYRFCQNTLSKALLFQPWRQP